MPYGQFKVYPNSNNSVAFGFRHLASSIVRDSKNPLVISVHQCLAQCESPPKAYLDRLPSISNINQLMKVTDTYFIRPENEDDLRHILKAREFLFQLGDDSIIDLSYKEFVLLTPFVSSWYMRRSGNYKLGTGEVVRPLKCRNGKRIKNRSHVCPRMVHLIVNFKAHRIALLFKKAHNHDMNDLIKQIPSLYLRSFLKYTVSQRIDVKSRQVLVDMRNKLTDPSIAQKIGLDDVNMMWVRNGLQSVLKEQKNANNLVTDDTHHSPSDKDDPEVHRSIKYFDSMALLARRLEKAIDKGRHTYSHNFSQKGQAFYVEHRRFQHFVAEFDEFINTGTLWEGSTGSN